MRQNARLHRYGYIERLHKPRSLILLSAVVSDWDLQILGEMLSGDREHENKVDAGNHGFVVLSVFHQQNSLSDRGYERVFCA